MTVYQLTPEGKKYLESGLPEHNLVKLLAEKPLDIKTARSLVEGFDIALMWAKKKELVKIEHGVIHLVKKDHFDEEKVLKEVEDHKLKHDEETKNIIFVLLQRRLIEEKRETMEKKAEKLAGKEVASLSEELIKTGMWKSVKLRPYNVT